MDDCNFDFGKATLQESSYTVLDELVAYMNRKADEKLKLAVIPIISAAMKKSKLSEERANTVRAYLLTKGIDPDRVTAKVMAWMNPLKRTVQSRAVPKTGVPK